MQLAIPRCRPTDQSVKEAPMLKKIGLPLILGTAFAVLIPAGAHARDYDRDLVFGAILPPRQPAFGKAVDDAADFLLASHPAIFASIARPIKLGSSDAYDRCVNPSAGRPAIGS